MRYVGKLSLCHPRGLVLTIYWVRVGSCRYHGQSSHFHFFCFHGGHTVDDHSYACCSIGTLLATATTDTRNSSRSTTTNAVALRAQDEATGSFQPPNEAGDDSQGWIMRSSRGGSRKFIKDRSPTLCQGFVRNII